jgi:hypothetical protein
MSFVNASSANAAVGASGIVISAPTGVLAGDVLLVALTANKNTWTVPSGFTQLQMGESSGNAFRSYLYYKVAGPSEPTSYVFNKDADTLSPLAADMVAIRGCDNVNPINDSAVDVQGSVSSGADPGTGISVTRTGSPTRGIYWRTARQASNTALTFAETSGGYDMATQTSAGTGTVRYGQASAYTGDFSSLGTNGAPAGGVTASATTSDNIHFMVQLLGSQVIPGDVEVGLPKVSAIFAGHHRIDATVTTTLPKLRVSVTGTAAPPSGSVATVLPKLGVGIAGTATGGPVAAVLPVVSSSLAGAVNPIGTFALTLPRLTQDYVVETRPHGENVIVVEDEKRAFRISQDDMVDVYRKQTESFEGIFGVNKFKLPSLQVLLFSPDGDILQMGVDLPSIDSSISGAVNPTAFTAIRLPRLSADLSGNSESQPGGSLNAQLPALNPDFEGYQDVIWAGMSDFSSGTSDLTVNLPSGRLPGDVWLLIAESGPSDTLSVPAGWTPVASSPQTTSAGSQDTKLSVFWAVFTGSEAAPTISFSGDHLGAQIHAFRGCDIAETDPIDVEGGLSDDDSNTLVNVPSVSTQGRGEMVVYVGAHGIDASGPQASIDTDVGVLDNFTERADNGFTDGAGGGFFVYTGNCPTPRFVGSSTFDIASASPRAAITLALLALTGAGPVGEDDLLKFTTDVGDGTNTSYTVSHNFGSRDVSVTVYDNTTFEEVEADVVHTSLNTVTVSFTSAPASSAYRVVVLYSSV